MLLVLVDESSATPHLLTRSGAIYVRNPGSSDPVPLADQARLLDLTRRGQLAEQRAIEAANDNLAHELLDDRASAPVETLSVAATGVAADFEDNLFRVGSRAFLEETAWGPSTNQQLDGRSDVWRQDHVGVIRWRARRFEGPIHEAIAVHRNGSVWTYRAIDDREEGSNWRSSVDVDELRQRFETHLQTCRIDD